MAVDVADELARQSCDGCSPVTMSSAPQSVERRAGVVLGAALNACLSGVLAALLSFISTLALAATALACVGADATRVSVAVSVSCAGIAVLGACLTLKYRMPVFVSWSVPGAALLAGVQPGLSFPVAMGGFVGAAAFAIAAGIWPAFVRLAERLPAALAAALLAGLLFPFTLHAVEAFRISAPIAGIGLIAYLLGRRLAPQHALLFVLSAMGAYLAITSIPAPLSLPATPLPMPATTPAPIASGWRWTAPHWQMIPVLSLAVPLFMVSLVAQNLPGVALLRQQGHASAVRPLFSVLGAGSMLLAPFGVFGLNLAPISAALCSGADDPGADVRRYRASLAYAASYLLLAVFSHALLRAMVLLPKPAILCTTGLALLVPLANALHRMLQDGPRREAAVLAFLTGASGVTFAGIGASFWALVTGIVALLILN